MLYNWQQNDWPDFCFKTQALQQTLAKIAQHSGNASGLIEGLPSDIEAEAILDLMICEAIETSEIEGESLQRSDVMSSIRNNLGLTVPRQPVNDAASEGIGQLMVITRQDFKQPLSEEMLFDWHRLLMKAEKRLLTGQWRTGESPMQIVSGRIDNPKVYFEAPPSSQIPEEMTRFINWFNTSTLSGPVRAAVAHLYFESIHPFEDGNGRIGRAISEKALSQGFGQPLLMSLSKIINASRKDYYRALLDAQKGNEITAWVEYFVHIILEAQIKSEQDIRFTLKKTKFYRHFEPLLNARQKKIVVRMLKSGADGFEGGMNARKYISIAKTSKATATRDLQELVTIGAFESSGAGPSSRYHLNLS